ncbi:MAG: AAA family ATPase [Eubacteriales bacterium]|nr:AAA family ATPase [Eubacteriales bacterium]
MKIAICGKGGSGKSTTTSLLAKALARMGKEVLVIDSDESNYGLHRQLGMELPKDFTVFFGGKGKVLEDLMMNQFSYQFFNETWTLSDIPQGFFSEKDGVKLMASGKIHVANEGCGCAMGTVISQFIDHMTLTENQFALMDMEAGIEHFGRGIDNGVDMILMILDASYESIRLSKKVSELAASIGKPVYFALNKADDKTRQAVLASIEEPEKVIAVIPQNEEVFQRGLTGEALDTEIKEVTALASFLADHSGENTPAQ